MAQSKLKHLLGFAVLAASALLAACDTSTISGTRNVEIAGETFTLELAMDPDSRLQGLSDRESVDEDGGMLFVFPDEAERQFVMRRCLVPIDILFLGPSGRVLAMHAMEVEPAGTPERELTRYASHGKSSVAIELAGGTLERLEIEIDDKIALPVRELKRAAR